MNTEMSRPGRPIRFIYLLALSTAILSQLIFIGSSWVALVFGGGGGSLVITPILAWRFVHVWRNDDALTSPPAHPMAAFVRGTGIMLMVPGVLGVVAQFFVGALTHLLLERSDGGEAGVAYFVVGVGLYLISSLIVPGVLVFELGRWAARVGERIGVERSQRVAGVAIGAVVTLAIFGMFVAISRSGKPLRSYMRPVPTERMQLPSPSLETVEVRASASEPARVAPQLPARSDPVAAPSSVHASPQRIDRDAPSSLVISPVTASPTMVHAPPIELSVMSQIPRSPPRPDYRGAVRLAMGPQADPRRTTSEGLTVSYCCAGAFSTARATRTVPAGRSYLEAMFVAQPGEQEMGTWSSLNISVDGIQPGHFAPLRGVRSGDVVGITVDTDAQLAEYEINGKPTGVQRLQVVTGRESRLWVSVSAPARRSNESDKWIVNFGAEPFEFPRTEPVLTYEGRLHPP